MVRACCAPRLVRPLRRLEDPASSRSCSIRMAGCGSTGFPSGLEDTGERLSRGRRRTDRPARRASCRRRGACRLAPRLGRAAGDWRALRGLMPPVVSAPAFAIRKPAVAVFTLDDYVAAGDHVRAAGRRRCALPLPSAGTSWSPAARRPARRRSSTRCSPRSPRPATASC